MRLISILFVTLLLFTIILTGCGGTPAATTTTNKTTVTMAFNNPTTTTSAGTTAAPVKTSQATQPPQTIAPPTGTIPTTPKNGFTATSPAIKFTADDISFLKISFTGTPSVIANAIKKWQEDNWVFAASQMDYPDVSDPIRWNYFLPGIFTSRDIVHEQVRNSKVYGICFSYAITYASIAEYYGLETRIVSSISKPSDTDKTITITTGLSPDEYNRLKTKLTRAGLNYSYDAIRSVAQETPTHYWAEVKLDGQWVIMDATEKATGNDTKSLFIVKNDFEIVNWAKRDMSAVLNNFKADNHQGDGNQPPVTTAVFTPTPSVYAGITDELGQAHRAANIDDVMQGKALVPYFNNASDAYTFCHVTGVAQSVIDQEQQGKIAYEAQSGKKLYVVALLINHDKTGSALATAYYNVCGVELDLQVYNALFSQH